MPPSTLVGGMTRGPACKVLTLFVVYQIKGSLCFQFVILPQLCFCGIAMSWACVSEHGEGDFGFDGSGCQNKTLQSRGLKHRPLFSHSSGNGSPDHGVSVVRFW